MNNEEYNPRAKALMIEVVDEQLINNDPPETKATLKRLVSLGYSKQVAKEKIAAVVVEHIYSIMHDGKDFDLGKYIEDLNAIK